MAKDKAAGKGLEANARLERVLKAGADNVSILRGYIGPAERNGYVRLFASLADTSVSVEIAEDDIVDTGDVYNNTLGKRIIWIKKGAQITVTKTHTTPFGIRPQVGADNNGSTVRAGRLNMRLNRAVLRDTCVSVCSCQTCESHCTDWCGVCVCQKAE